MPTRMSLFEHSVFKLTHHQQELVSVADHKRLQASSKGSQQRQGHSGPGRQIPADQISSCVVSFVAAT